MADAHPPLDFARVFASPALAGSAPVQPRIAPGGGWVAVLRPREGERSRHDLWGWERASGQWRMLVDSTRLEEGAALSEAEKMRRERLRLGERRGILSFGWTRDGTALVVPTPGALWLAGLDGALERLDTGTGAIDARLSPAGGYVSYLAEGRLWVAPRGRLASAITPAESADTVRWGEAEFVAQEEMARLSGYWWAPDDSRLAVQRFDESGVAEVLRASIGGEGTAMVRQRYPAAGTANAAVALWLMAPDGSDAVRVDLGEGADVYLARVDWAPDGRALYVQRQDRAQGRLDMLKVDPATGAASLLFTEEAAPGHWINLSDAYRFLANGRLVWWSERDGHGHLWLLADGAWRQLTDGAWDVTDLAGVDEAGERLFFAATRDDVLAQQIYALDYSTPGAGPERLTQDGFVHAASMDAAGQAMIVTRHGPDQPPQAYLADGQGTRLAWLAENRVEGNHPYAPHRAAHRLPQFGTLEAEDGTTLHWRMILPEMVAGQRYPVFFEHYGGPHVQLVQRGWTGALAQAIVAMGYIHFQIDNRGSAHRGVAFESAIRMAMGTPEVADQRAGARYLQGLPFVDPGKIATYGWSYGGYLTLKMLAADQGLYAAGIAGAPVTRWQLYDTHYTERYLGDPRLVPEVYDRANALDGLTALADPLLLIHGLADDNVVFAHSAEAIARLQANAQAFEMMLYPGQAHGVGGPGVSEHLWNTIFRFLARHGVTPP